MMTTITVSGLERARALTDFLNDFFFRPASPRPLAALRIGISSLLLWQAFLIHKSFFLFFATTGFVQKEVSKLLNDASAPSLSWAISFLGSSGVDEKSALAVLGFLYVMSLVFLLFGCFTRWSAFFAWFLHWSLQNTGYSGSYGADMYAHIFLFYCIWIPCGEAFSLDIFFKGASGQPSYQARLGVRVLQLHMCISYLASGLEKVISEQWRRGEVLWDALNSPIYSAYDFLWMAYFPFLPLVGSWIAMAVEILYCVMVWPRKIRFFWVLATCFLHIGIAIFLKLHVFGILMCIPTLALFAVSSESNKAQQC